MRISFNISAAQAMGIKKYLKSVDPDVSPNITAQDVKDFVIGEALGLINYGAVSDFVSIEEAKQSKQI